MQQLVAFVRGHLLQVALIIPGAVVITLLHESAHALAVLLQGGSVTEFQWLPTASGWGHIRFAFPGTMAYSPAVISLAPHILSLLCVFATAALAWRRSIQRERIASFIYFWLFFVPLADIGFALSVWTLGGDNDVAKAFGPARGWSLLVVIGYGLAAVLLGYVVQARLYDRLRLDWAPYGVLAVTAVLLMAGFLTAMSAVAEGR